MRHRSAFLTGLAVLLAMLGALGFSAYRWFVARSTGSLDSLAVLPFTNVTGDPNTEYLSDGLTESLISSLSQLPNLAVRPRSSVIRYKAKEVDLQKAAEELKVHGLVTGRVTQRGDALEVAVELTDVSTNRNLWSEQYSRKLADALSVEREIAREVSTRLREHLTGEQKAEIHKGETTNPEAFQLYLKGRYYWDKRTPEGLEKAKQYFQEAIDKDQSYARAYLGLAEYYLVAPEYTDMPMKDANPNIKIFARKSLELDDTLAEAHAALGIAHDEDWEWAAAEREFGQAQTLEPTSARTHILYGFHCLALGKLDEARAQFQRGVELEPLNLNDGYNVAQADFFKGEYEKSMAEANKVLEIDPNFANAHAMLRRNYYMLGKYEEWLEEWEKEVRLTKDAGDLARLEGAKQGYAKSGIRGAFKAMLEVDQSLAKRTFVDPALFAQDYAYLGEKDKAFEWLEKAAAEKSDFMQFLMVDPAFAPLRGDPRYAGLLKRMGLPQ